MQQSGVVRSSVSQGHGQYGQWSTEEQRRNSINAGLVDSYRAVRVQPVTPMQHVQQYGPLAEVGEAYEGVSDGDYRFDDCFLHQPMPPYDDDSGDELEGSVDGSVRSSGRSGESDVSRADSEGIAHMHEWDHTFLEYRSDSEDEAVAEYDTESVCSVDDDDDEEEEEYSGSSPVEECDAYDDQY